MSPYLTPSMRTAERGSPVSFRTRISEGIGSGLTQRIAAAASRAMRRAQKTGAGAAMSCCRVFVGPAALRGRQRVMFVHHAPLSVNFAQTHCQANRWRPPIATGTRSWLTKLHVARCRYCLSRKIPHQIVECAIVASLVIVDHLTTDE